MRLETRQTPDHAAAPIPAPLCPHCGRDMSATTADNRRFKCSACGETQNTDMLSRKDIQSQQSHLHSRGIDRLLGAVLSAEEPK